MKWGKDKTPTGSFDPAQPFSPASTQAPGFPATPTYYPQYGGECITKTRFEKSMD